MWWCSTMIKHLIVNSITTLNIKIKKGNHCGYTWWFLSILNPNVSLSKKKGSASPHHPQFVICEFESLQIMSSWWRWFFLNHKCFSEVSGRLHGGTSIRYTEAPAALLHLKTLLDAAEGISKVLNTPPHHSICRESGKTSHEGHLYSEVVWAIFPSYC